MVVALRSLGRAVQTSVSGLTAEGGLTIGGEALSVERMGMHGSAPVERVWCENWMSTGARERRLCQVVRISAVISARRRARRQRDRLSKKSGSSLGSPPGLVATSSPCVGSIKAASSGLVQAN
jgi:hypothetical protein